MAETNKPDPEKIRQKVQFLRDALRQLNLIRERGEAELIGDPILQAAAIRYIQVGIEAILDTANHIIARQGLGLPKSYRESLELLTQEGILPGEKGEDFVAMVGFRNRAVHLYQQIEPGEVWKILEEDLGDFELFIHTMAERYL
jgi:uncharacterized protein YutE (UPF0331/DUF86 family)